MGSKRLPRKSMKLITPKYKLIDFIIGNALQSTYINKKNIFLLTSKNKNNKILISYVKKNMELKFLKAQRKMFIVGIKNLMTERTIQFCVSQLIIL